MKLTVFDLTKNEAGKKELPEQFNEEVRPDIIKKAVYIIQSHKRQPYSSDPRAGKKAAATLSRRRRDFKTSYGHGISRVPRKTLNRRGTRMYWVGAYAPGTVGGRRSHPPKAGKIYALKMNKKERRKAIRSAMAATVNAILVKNRGHIIPNDYPFILKDAIESISKTKEVIAVLEKLGFADELVRVSNTSIRPGKGKSRGRKYRKIAGMLLVVSKDCQLLKSASNIPGLDVEIVNKLNAETLAPGANIGRLTLYTESAIERINKEKLFTGIKWKHEK